ncbi:MAG: DNA mismatch repair endonuclease MutL [Candidatus Omnitrophica bacterium]|nr:DNA mismatch repair endonuclease MutL [Candidatus Omnitrophota bacterium]
MPTIKILPEALANKIAAGEVIERPASIVKELVENSLDAGARFIEVTINHGGKSLIRVMDDGCGISASEIETAFKRHATSKISTDKDLEEIASYGFRGEALPSMAAVSRMTMTSRLQKASFGTEILMEGGRVTHVKEAACREGTTVEVRDLFFNTPARRKFMKSDTTELGHLQDILLNLSLSRLDVHFVFKNGDKKVFDLPPTVSLKDRSALYFGFKESKDLLDLDAQVSGIRIHGVIGKPSLAFANRSGQSFFINHRWVKSISFSYAVQAGYHGRLMHGQFPVAVIMIECDLNRVDVNVHPTKQEVRISNEAPIKSLVQQAVSKRLSEALDLSTRVQTTQREPVFSERVSESTSVNYGSFSSSSSRPELELTASTVLLAPIQMEAHLTTPLEMIGQSFITKVLGQIHGTFIVAETEEGLLLVDQHAAHERIQFEAVVKGFESGSVTKQNLLMDEIFEISSKQVEMFRNSLPFLQKTGFDIDEFGKHSFVIRAMPAVLSDENPQMILKQYLHELEDGKIKTTLGNHQEELAALIACKRRSVKAHEAMTLPAMRELLVQLFQCQNPYGCPHGRPSFLKFSFEDLEKQFKRKL